MHEKDIFSMNTEANLLCYSKDFCMSAIFLRTKSSVFPILPKQPWAIDFGFMVRASCLDTGEGTNCEFLPEPSLEVAAAAMCHIIGSNFPSSSYVCNSGACHFSHESGH